MKKIIILMAFILISGCSEDNITSNQSTLTEIAFALSEGAFQGNDASVHTLNTDQISITTGDTGQSMAVYGNKLLVVNNGSSNIVIYTISNEGLIEYDSLIDLNGSQPREILIIEDKAYISQWATHSIAVIDLLTTTLEQIELPGCSEGLTTNGTHLFTTIKYLNNTHWPYPAGNTVEKIDLSTHLVDTSFTVSNNPDMIIYHEGYLFIGSQYGDWPSSHISEKVDPESGTIIELKDYGSTETFGVDFAIHNNTIYRAYDKGIVALNSDLSIDMSTYIGTEYTGLYSMAINEDLIYLGFGDYTAPDNVIVINFDGNEVSNFEVGASPGSFAFWKSE
ncbi:MAG: hypothetical protein H8E72_03375 [Candidatus Marinimicrobia bacterium]|nr:hypothetical protein [Candidatus Neomarinimicrobiota bacterium]